MELEQLIAQYKQALILLRPQGEIWKVKVGSLTDLELDIWAEQLAKVHQTAEKLTKESIVSDTEELLNEYENLYELPHEGSYNERIAALLEAGMPKTSHSKSYYESIANMLGIEINIVAHVPFMFGLSECGHPDNDELGSEDMVYFWEIEILSSQSEEKLEKYKKLTLAHARAHKKLTFIDKRN
ncbi:MAG: putative phage tail protein [Alphaproteobacteria bacterium]